MKVFYSLGILATILLLSIIPANAQQEIEQAKKNSKSGFAYASSFSITRPLSELIAENPYKEPDFNAKPWVSNDRKNRPAQTFIYSAEDGPEYGNDPSIMQTKMGARTNINKAPLQNWAGVTSYSYPPDPTGAVGPNHYVQIVNATTVKIFNKTTGASLSTFQLGTLWGSSSNAGDPIVMYDKFADRWFLSQFGSSTQIYIAISKTSDPTGQYYTWTFNSTQFPDYLKFSIWQDGYYMTSNQTTDKILVFERSAMLAGSSSARMTYASFSTGSVSAFFIPLPADAADNSTLPASGTPLPFFSYYDNAWGGGSDAVKIWTATTTWGTTPSVSITGPVAVNTNAFNASYSSSWDDVPQPNGQYLDGIGGVLMFRVPWRSWSGYNSVVLSWGVLISNSPRVRAIYWCELRQTSGTWSMYQQGIYQPDSDTRWMSSVAMDDNGSIALCYAKSSTTTYPGLYYTGRQASDPLGIMTFEETTAIAGTSSQSSYNRFGDYSHTALDPDGITFWHTGQYCASSSGQETRIYSFQLPVNSAATILYDPSNAAVCNGASASFSVTASGQATISYQWQKNAANIPGATSSTYTISPVSSSDIGSYRCIVTNSLGADTSSAAALTINAATQITTQPVSVNVNAGDNVNLSVVASGASLTYQWKKNGANLSNGGNVTGVTTANLSMTNVTVSNYGTYTCVVTGACGTVTSDNAVVSVYDAIEEAEGKPQIFPNPSDGFFSISFGQNQVTGAYSIYDLDSKLLMSSDFTNTSVLKLDLSSYAEGTYMIKIEVEGKTYIERLIVK